MFLALNRCLKQSWLVVVIATACSVWVSTTEAQSDCGCATGVTKGYSLDQYGQSPCNSGCGTGWGRLRAAFSCDPKFRPGLWDGYCDERMACDRSPMFAGLGHGLMGAGCNSGCDGAAAAAPACESTVAPCDSGAAGCGVVAGLAGMFSRDWKWFHGCSLRKNCGRPARLRLFQFPQAAGCGSAAYGLPCGEPGCDSGCDGAVIAPAVVNNAGCDSCQTGCGCQSIFGIKTSCFRNDGHFFGCMSRHGHRLGALRQKLGSCGKSLFGCQTADCSDSIGLFGCGHCQNPVVDGCDSPVAAPQATDNAAPDAPSVIQSH